MSRELPILFNTKMVQAILEGRKTVTRRMIKFPTNRFTNKTPKATDIKPYYNTIYSDKVSFHIEPFYCCDIKPPYHLGDILYVREKFQYLYELDGNEQIIEGTGRYYYAATDTIPFDTYVDLEGITHQNIPWRPSIHMPKEAARIWLKITGVRVERLQDMNGHDVLKEGVVNHVSNPAMGKRWENIQRMTFAELWNSTIKKADLPLYGWDTNPWVWVIEFERCEKPERSDCL